MYQQHAERNACGRFGGLSRLRRTALAAAAGLAITAGCSPANDSASTEPDPKPSPSTPPTLSAKEQAENKAKKQVLAAYRGMVKVQTEMYQVADGDVNDLRPYARGKAVDNIVGAVFWYQQRGLVMKGTPKVSPTVSAVKMESSPKTAVLTDCYDASNFVTIDKKTGKSVEKKRTEKSTRTPLSATAEEKDGSWVVTDFTFDRDRGC